MDLSIDILSTYLPSRFRAIGTTGCCSWDRYVELSIDTYLLISQYVQRSTDRNVLI